MEANRPPLVPNSEEPWALEEAAEHGSPASEKKHPLMPDKKSAPEVSTQALHRCIDILDRLDVPSRDRILETLNTYYKSQSAEPRNFVLNPVGATRSSPLRFAEDRKMPLSKFIGEKKPKSAAELVTCIAYYSKYYDDRDSFDFPLVERMLRSIRNPLVGSGLKRALSTAARREWLNLQASGNTITASGSQRVQLMPADGLANRGEPVTRHAAATARKRR